MNKCAFCGHKTTAFYDEWLKQTAWRCQACHAVFKDPKVYLSSTLEKARYDTHNNTIDNEGYVQYLTTFMDQAVKPFIEEGSALDYGCGPGPVLGELLTRRGFDVSNYDPFYAPNEALLNKKYDLITLTEVLEHVFDPNKVFQTLAQALKPEGILAVMTSFVPRSNEDYLTWWYKRDATHVVFYHLKSFEALAERYGLTMLHTDHQKIITLKKVTL